MILLEDHERQKFIVYLEQQAEADEALAKQLEEPPLATPITEELAKRNRTHAAACRIVASNLRATTTETL